jgi:hypothetical protein
MRSLKSRSEENRDNLLLFGGGALLLLGAGLILSNSSIRKHLGGLNLMNLVRAVAPDIDRYLKLKEM